MIHSVDVIIPTYRPGPDVRTLLLRLLHQSYPVSHIQIVNTDETKWDPSITEGISIVQVRHIGKSAFDHGSARNLGAADSQADYIVFMTQDAIPGDRYMIGKLVEAMQRDPDVKAAYARQLPKKGCREIERFQRSFNYPPESRVKRIENLDELGIKTFFCSNVCACYDREYFSRSGGFAVPSIFNEDMVFAGNAVRAGYAIAYAAEARVLHSHNYTNREQFHRNFDNGVSQAMHPEIFEGIRSEGEGMKMVTKTAGYLLRKGKAYLIPGLVMQSACKLLGFRLGKNVKKLPREMIMRCTMSPEFWRNHEELLSDGERKDCRK
ncbi:MAG: glycosyltransferase family 2 protein [Lachnospiraceae bacterium]|nr:glycosyltransferase family 2 protein [Lachnospiraceae bacterium]